MENIRYNYINWCVIGVSNNISRQYCKAKQEVL